MLLVIGVIVYWLFCSLTAFYLVKKTFKYYAKHPQFPVPDHYGAFMRKDFGKWNQSEIIKGCFLRLPFKAPILIGYLLGFILLAYLRKYIPFPSKVIDLWRNYIGLLSMKMCFDLH